MSNALKIPGYLASLLYGCASGIHRAAVKGRDAGVPVISVGNITSGGTGKTPLVLKILDIIGPGAAVVMRGYGRKTRGIRTVNRPDSVIYGDEASMIKRKAPGCAVIVAENRLKGAVEARRAGAEAVVLDDGFQSYEIKRSADIIVIDCTDPFGGGCLLPLGRLREPLKSLARADAVVLNRSDAVPRDELKKIKETVNNYIPCTDVYPASEKPGGLESLEGLGESPAALLSGKKVLGFCGIGNPGGFARMLENAGAEVSALVTARDHHRWHLKELEEIRLAAETRGLIPVTTEKDYVRFPSGYAMRGFVLRLVTELENEEGFKNYVLSKV